MSCDRPFKRQRISMETAAYEFHEIQDEVKKISLEIPETVLAGQTYHASDVHQWTTDISSQCLKELKGVANGSAGFKYIVNCTILQKRNAGFHTNSSCFWDAKRDGEIYRARQRGDSMGERNHDMRAYSLLHQSPIVASDQDDREYCSGIIPLRECML